MEEIIEKLKSAYKGQELNILISLVNQANLIGRITELKETNK